MDLSPFTFFVSETKLCIAKFFQFQKMVDEISVDSFDNVWKVVVVFFFSFDMQQGHMGEGEVILSFLTFECLVVFGEDPGVLIL